ncbi:MAG: ribonuclease HII [Bacteroidota bacterium]
MKGKLKKYLENDRLEAGCDEAGRGCLAGPVTAAAVILDPKKPIKGLNDSKALTKKQRDELRLEIEEKALAWHVEMVPIEKIEELNILHASLYGMLQSAKQLKIQPEHLLIDGNRFVKESPFAHTCVVKGDAKFQSIAAASVLAKTHRDEYMQEQAKKYPHYDWENNKGYPTKKHRDGIREYGASPIHRRSFQLLPGQLNLFD